MNGGVLKLENDILRRKLPRDLPVAPVVRPLYLETWDALRAES